MAMKYAKKVTAGLNKLSEEIKSGIQQDFKTNDRW
ncbi:MAG: hypothetical protein ACI9M9_000066 [Flavobacteriaceae bacterium]|jgi:hypothetical protein